MRFAYIGQNLTFVFDYLKNIKFSTATNSVVFSASFQVKRRFSISIGSEKPKNHSEKV